MRILASPVLRLGLIALLIVGALALALSADEASFTALRSWIDDLGAVGGIVFVAVYAVATVLLLPGTPFSIGAGVLFGPVLGSAVALTGATLGATGSFLVGRGIGRGAVEQLAGRRVQAVDRMLTERGFVAMLLVRLVPLFPFNVVNLVAGITALRLRQYVLATAIGIVPGTVLLAALGGTIDDPTSPAFLGALAGFLVLTVAGGLVARRLRGRSVASGG